MASPPVKKPEFEGTISHNISYAAAWSALKLRPPAGVAAGGGGGAATASSSTAAGMPAQGDGDQKERNNAAMRACTRKQRRRARAGAIFLKKRGVAMNVHVYGVCVCIYNICT